MCVVQCFCLINNKCSNYWETARNFTIETFTTILFVKSNNQTIHTSPNQLTHRSSWPARVVCQLVWTGVYITKNYSSYTSIDPDGRGCPRVMYSTTDLLLMKDPMYSVLRFVLTRRMNFTNLPCASHSHILDIRYFSSTKLKFVKL